MYPEHHVFICVERLDLQNSKCVEYITGKTFNHPVCDFVLGKTRIGKYNTIIEKNILEKQSRAPNAHKAVATLTRSGHLTYTQLPRT